MPSHAHAATVVATTTSTISSDTEWTTSGSPYEILAPVTVASGAVLTIEPGVVVKFATTTIGNSFLIVNGALNAGSGTATQEVVFTSLADDAYGGDTNGDGAASGPADNRWSSITFDQAATSTIFHARLRYGGAGDTATDGAYLSVQDTPVTVSDSTFEDTSGYGFFLGATADLTFTRDRFGATFYLTKFSTAVSDATSTSLTMHESSIGTTSAAVIDFRSGSYLTHIENNWWGSASGPVSLGYSDPALVFSTPYETCDALADANCALPAVSSVLFLPGTEASRLYYRDGLGVEHQVWEPDLFTDIPYLAMNTDGSSKFDLYTKDIVDSMFGNNALEHAAVSRVLSASDLDIYGGLESYLDGLVASTTLRMTEWRAYPYDWRYDVRDVIADGTRVAQSDGTVASVRLADVLGQMASSSASGKVTVIGHSNGGLLAKALASALGASASDYIDRLILVGTPQWGTPSAIGAMLHSDNLASLPRLVVRRTDARAAQTYMGDPYDLLPSSTYFSHVSDPVVTFDPAGSLSNEFANAFGALVHSFSALSSFLTDASLLDTTVGAADDLRAPVPLDAALIAKGAATHGVLDSWTPPAGISVTAIAGWGQETTSGLLYTTASKATCTSITLFSKACADSATLRHTPILTQDGDGTVVSPSATGNTRDAFYFNAAKYRDDNHGNFLHQNLTSSLPVQIFISELLVNNANTTSTYIFSSKPTNGSFPLSIVSSHSPVYLVATDSNGNQAGVVPASGLDFPLVKTDIPGSSVEVFDDENYVFLPASGSYSVVATGYASGPAAIETGSVASDGSLTTTYSFSNIPIATSSAISLTLDGTTASSSALSIDEDADGQTDAVLDLGAATSTSFVPLAPPVTVHGGAGAGENETKMLLTVTAPANVEATVTPEAVSTTPAAMEALVSTSTRGSSIDTGSSSPSSSLPSRDLPLRPVPVPSQPPSKTQQLSVPQVTFSQSASVADALSEPPVRAAVLDVYDWVGEAFRRELRGFIRLSQLL